MDSPIERVPPQVRILPPRRQKDGRRKHHFIVDGEPRPPAEGEPVPVEERPLGHAAPEEAGKRLDVTA